MENKTTYQKIDPQTGEHFIPHRSNQIFASRRNQIAFNNAKALYKRKAKSKIDRILNKNREILQHILGTEEVVFVSKDFLLGQGFNLTYFTHQALVKGIPVSCIYEYVILMNESKDYKVWKHEF